MEFDPTFDWGNVIASLALCFAVLSNILAWWLTSRGQVEKRLSAGSKRMDELNLRLSAAEQSIATMPGKDDLHGLQLTLAEMAGEMKAIRVSVRGVAESQGRLESIVTRHEDYLRENS